MEGPMLPFTVENIEAVLHRFYNDVQNQAQANQYLILAQISSDAWTFSWQLLDQSKPTEVQFFGASTLQSKITNHWKEVPSDQYEALRSKLLQAIFTYINGPKFILTRLCVAMSSFVIQTILNFWPSAIYDLMTTFSSQNASNSNPHHLTCVLLELLTILSEELNTTFMSRPKINLVRHALGTSFQTIVSFIESVISKNNISLEACDIALKCYSSWSQIGSMVFEYHSLLALTFDAVYRPELCQTALETLSNIATHSLAYKYPDVILAMIEKISKFDALISETIRDKDLDKCCSIYAMVISVAETHAKLLLTTVLEKPEKKDEIMKIIGYILQCSGTPGQYPIDEICSEQAFGFWYTLQDQIVSSDPKKFEKLLLEFHSVFQTLLDTYLMKLRYPNEDSYKHWNSEEIEAFRCYRQDIGDSIMFCYNILRQAALANLVAHLAIAIPAASNSLDQWQYLEACLFAFKEIAESVDINEQFYIHMFMSQLPTIPLQHVKVVSVAMEAIGAYAEWINVHPEVMGFVIPLLLMGLQSAEIAPSATFALKDITKDCHTSLKPYADQILSASQEALTGNIVMSREKVRLMSTIGHVLSIMPYSQIMNFLDFLLPPIIKSLQEAAARKCESNIRSTVVLNLHMLSVLFGSLDTKLDYEPGNEQDRVMIQNNDPQPVFLILQQVMPIFQQLVTEWEPSEQITEALCECLRKAVSTLLDDARPFVSHIVQLVLHLYRSYTHSAVLDVAKQILLLFAGDENQRPELASFLMEICHYTLNLAIEDFWENTTVLDIFFQLLSQILKKAFIYFQNEKINFKLLFECATSAIELPEKLTVKSASSFLSEFITRSRSPEVPYLADVVNACGEKLVTAVLKVIGGKSPRSVVEHMPDILIALNKKYFDNLCRWLNSFVQDNTFLPERLNQSQREEFARLILKERTNKRKLKETVTEFSLLCRGLIGTEYANQSITH